MQSPDTQVVTGGIVNTTPWGVVFADAFYDIVCWLAVLSIPVILAAILVLRNNKETDSEESDREIL